MTHALTIVLDDKLVTLNAAVGLLRRRNLPLRSVALGPHVTEGRSRLFVMIEADEASARRVALLFEKLVGVESARVTAAGEMVVRESALITLQPGPSGYAELLDVLSLYHATVIEEGPDVVVAELTGPEAFVLSCLRAVERFGILDVARSGAVAIARPAPASRASTPSEVRVP